MAADPLPSPGPAGLLLTGGAARRLGAAKADLRRGGETLGSRAARVLRAVCSGPVLEVGPGATDLPAVREAPAGGGPLAALAAGGAALRSRGYRGPVLLLAVDLPLVDEALLDLLAGWPGASTAVPESGGHLQTVCARYGPPALAAAETLVANGSRSLQALFAVVEHEIVPERAWQAVASPGVFRDVDTPADAIALGVVLPGPDDDGDPGPAVATGG
jgi:molybdopterin-guanine dinucleotide biosynthesis protein A